MEHYVYIGGVVGETKTMIYVADLPDFPDTEQLPLKTIQKKLEGELEEHVKALDRPGAQDRGRGSEPARYVDAEAIH